MKYFNKFNLKNKIAYVVGGSGLIGEEICLALSEFGAKVLNLDLKNNKKLQTNKKIKFCNFNVKTTNLNSSKKKSTKEPKFNSKQKPQSKEKFVPPLNDIAEYMSLEEIKEYLLEDEELTDEERFDLYYEEHRRVQEEKNSMSYEELLRKSGVNPPIKN